MRREVPVLNKVIKMGLTKRVRFDELRVVRKSVRQTYDEKHPAERAHPKAGARPHEMTNSTGSRVRNREKE